MRITIDTNVLYQAVFSSAGASHAGIPTSIDFLWRPNLRDETDNMFVELAVASGSEYLVTKNRRHYSVGTALRFDSFKVVTPAEFMTLWRKDHG